MEQSTCLIDYKENKVQEMNEIQVKNYQNALKSEENKRTYLPDKEGLFHLSKMKQDRKQQPSSEVNCRISAHQFPLDYRAQIGSEQAINWRDGGKAQFRMCRGATVTAMKDNVVYFLDWNGKTCSYNSTSKKWSELAKYPYQYASLIIIDGQLTGIGGCSDICKEKTYTNKLLSLCKNDWIDLLPPMPTKRRDMTTINAEKHVIVAGGMSGPFINASIATVEMMDTDNLTWSSVASLPHRYTGASAAICGDHLFMLGGFDHKGETKSVLTCSLAELLLSSSSSSVWQRVVDAPAYQSTGASVGGELLVVGGCDKIDNATAVVHKYNPTTDSWNIIGKMPTARYNCLITVLPGNEMMVVGGEVQWNRTVNIVEIANFNYYLC